MGTLSGMTGFARVTGEAAWGGWAWEAKSVNGRSLDVRVNVPPGAEALEREVKAMAAARFNRGSLQVGLRIELAASGATAVINEALLADLAQAARKVSGRELSSEAIATLMAVKGVVDAGATSTRDVMDEAAIALLTAAAGEALDGLAEGRRAEGASLAVLLGDLLNEMERLTGVAETFAGTQPDLIRAKLTKQLEDLDREGRVDAERYAAEVALSAAKADVREELDRLAAHIKTGRELLKAGSPAGRKLDFLAQELNREANTLCSKSLSLDLTNAGLGLKGVIDQFKEQSANVE
ncbi:YicC family protein [Hyphomonas sp. CACIAM 19H1]|uniref:YicC/YloC family endoribonuclease n=1 Tax=Hyphomonas sp. CACIAM 19H1 TaxID=1873716 RepID=UPI000DEE0C92|nr:YicC/YloC family endoribonuclease [Hyphomonas sp. CACIAM 19H1]AXE64881.1 YicC family protein [Hyphomonas sp. CACIAM 19H1]